MDTSIIATQPLTEPTNRSELRMWLKDNLGLCVTDRALCPDHQSPMDYLWYAYSTDLPGVNRTNGDAVIWANRGGGKTILAAALTLMDCLFKDHCHVRILAGSGDQAQRMYGYLRNFITDGFKDHIDGDVLRTRCRFKNGSSVEVLTQSDRSVRGRHFQKLRCDEVELFKEDIFNAAKFTTHSSDTARSAMEVLSTMHRPYGLMQKVVNNAIDSGVPVFKWCLWEVIEKCTDRICSRCPLNADCGGKAKRGGGYLKIDDCITMMNRSSRTCWETEILCSRPKIDNVVFGEFDPKVHIAPVCYDPNLPLYRTLDFGFVNPFVCLWIQVDEDGVVRVLDEYVMRRRTIPVNGEKMMEKTPCPESRVAATFCDPAGSGPSDTTGTSSKAELKKMGIEVKHCKSRILQGIEMIRTALLNAAGKRSMIISPNCKRLIEAMQCYHYPQNTINELPFKDGVYDHPIDALRYFFVNYSAANPPIQRRRY